MAHLRFILALCFVSLCANVSSAQFGEGIKKSETRADSQRWLIRAPAGTNCRDLITYLNDQLVRFQVLNISIAGVERSAINSQMLTRVFNGDTRGVGVCQGDLNDVLRVRLRDINGDANPFERTLRLAPKGKLADRLDATTLRNRRELVAVLNQRLTSVALLDDVEDAPRLHVQQARVLDALLSGKAPDSSDALADRAKMLDEMRIAGGVAPAQEFVVRSYYLFGERGFPQVCRTSSEAVSAFLLLANDSNQSPALVALSRCMLDSVIAELGSGNPHAPDPDLWHRSILRARTGLHDRLKAYSMFVWPAGDDAPLDQDWRDSAQRTIDELCDTVEQSPAWASGFGLVIQ